jgi:anti-anti-sigma factor
MTPFDDLGDLDDALPAVEAEEPAPRTALLRVRGDFDEITAGLFAGVVDDEVGGGGISRILVDLSRVTLLTSAALRALQQLRRRCRVQDMHLVLVGTAHPAVHRPLLTSGLLPLFDTRLNLQAALRGDARHAHRSVHAAPRSG